MKYALPTMLAAGFILTASAYPAISNSSTVQLNQWTYKYNEGLAKAAATGRPVMLAFVNQGACSYCAKWDIAVLSNPDGRWNAFLAANPMVLIWVDQAKESLYASPSWRTLIDGNGKWGTVTGYPEIVILAPGGAKRDQFIARSTLGVYSGFSDRVARAIGGIPSGPVTPGPVTPGPVPPTNPTTPAEPTGTFPSTGAGTYLGVLLDSADGVTVRGSLQMAATAAGRITVKLNQGGTSTRVTASSVKSTATDGSYAFTSGALTLNVTGQGRISGSFNGLPVSGGKTGKGDMTPFAGYYTTALAVKGASELIAPVNNQPEGSGFLTLNVTRSASVKYSGLLPDGTKVSGASALWVYDGSELAALGYAGGVSGRPYACFVLYKSIYRGRGSVAGLVWIDASYSLANASDNQVLITGSEWRYPGKSASLTSDRFTADFDAGNVTSIGAFYVKGMDLASVYTGLDFFVDGQDQASIVALGRSIKTGTGQRPSLRASLYTGLISGTVTHPENGKSSTYKGVLVPSFKIGAGFYLVADTAPGYTIKRSYPILIED